MMPDHAHLLVEGTTTSADLRRFAKLAKQRSGAAYAMRVDGALWQEGYSNRHVGAVSAGSGVGVGAVGPGAE
jgi:REP element-mobilizing transposase RayT